MRRNNRKPLPVLQRTCGDCHACCVVVGFEAEPGESSFRKPARTPCRHLRNGSCGIYRERPPVCRRFQCAWLMAENLPEELRPDRCGVMFCTNDNPLGEGYVVYAYELVPGALEDELPEWLIEQVAEETTVLLIREGEPVEVLTKDPAVGESLAAFARTLPP